MNTPDGQNATESPTWHLFSNSAKISVMAQRSLETSEDTSLSNLYNGLERFVPALIFGFALIFRMAYLIDMRTSPIFDVFLLDAEYYDRMARHIRAGDWLAGREIFSMSPLYPYFLALLYALTGDSVTAVKFVQHLIGAATCGLLCRIGIRLGGVIAGLAAGILAAAYGLLIFVEGTFENEFLVLFLNTLALWFLLEAAGASRRAVVVAGLAIGLSAGIRPNAALLTIPIILWIFRGVQFHSKRLACISFFILAVILPVLPITFRNYYVSGEWVLTTSTGGQLIYIGTLQDGGGGYAVPPFVEAHPNSEHDDFRLKAAEDLGRPVAASEVSDYWIRQAFVRIGADPAGYVRLLGKKLLAFFNTDEAPDNYNYLFGRRYSRVLSLPLAGIDFILPLAVLGLIVAVRPFWRWFLPISFFAVYLLSVLLFYQSYRFRLPAVPSLLLFAGTAVVWIVRQIRERSFLHLFSAGLILVLTTVISQWPLPQTRTVMDAVNMAGGYAEALRNRGRLQPAAEMLRDALKIQPNDPPSIRQLADILRDLHEYREAISLYRRIANHPEVGNGVYGNIALCNEGLEKLAHVKGEKDVKLR